MASSSPSPSSSSQPRENSSTALLSARRLLRIPGTGELIASPFPDSQKKKKKAKKAENGTSSSSWQSTSSAAFKKTIANTLTPSGKKRLVVYAADAPRNLTPALRPGKAESAKKSQTKKEAEAAKAEEAAVAVASCTLHRFLTTTRATAKASRTASEISATAPTNAGVLSEAARVARRAAAVA